jgi:UDP-N-acetylglucosamine 3-dehydrogenase
MSRSIINLAFLGCGGVTRTHSRTLRAFRDKVRCFYASRDQARADAFARECGGAGSFHSYDAALADDNIDVALIATPPSTHFALTIAALDHGKDVIVEKPAYPRVSDFAAVLAAEQRSGHRVLVAENYCYKPLARVLQSVVASGTLGEIRFVHLDAAKRQRQSGWRADPEAACGGALLEGGVHWIDLLLHLGLHVETVHGFRPGDWKGIEQSMLLVVQYEQGAVGTLTHSWEIPSLLRGLRLSHIYGTRGSVAFESNGLFALVTGSRTKLIMPGLRDISGYRAMFSDFLDVLLTGKEPRMTLERAQRSVELVEASYRDAPATHLLETVP